MDENKDVVVGGDEQEIPAVDAPVVEGAPEEEAPAGEEVVA